MIEANQLWSRSIVFDYMYYITDSRLFMLSMRTWRKSPGPVSLGHPHKGATVTMVMYYGHVSDHKVTRIHLRKFTTCYSEKISVATNHFHRILGHQLYYIGSILSIVSDWNPSYTIESHRLRLDSIILLIFIMDGLDPTPQSIRLSLFQIFGEQWNL